MVAASGCAPLMPPMPPETISLPASSPPRCFSPAAGERLVGALDDALRADVNPRAGGHLAVHDEAELLQLVELLPVGPVADEVGVADEHARRVVVGAEDADRLARLHQQRLVVVERAAASGRWRDSTPSCARRGRCRRRRRGPAGARRRRGRGCSSACAWRLPAPILCRRAGCRAGPSPGHR